MIKEDSGLEEKKEKPLRDAGGPDIGIDFVKELNEISNQITKKEPQIVNKQSISLHVQKEESLQ